MQTTHSDASFIVMSIQKSMQTSLNNTKRHTLIEKNHKTRHFFNIFGGGNKPNVYLWAMGAIYLQR